MPGTVTIQRPTALEIARGTASTVEAYITELIQTTAPSLESCLALSAAQGGIGHAGKLNSLGRFNDQDGGRRPADIQRDA